MRGSASLLAGVQGLLERTYRMRSGLRDLAPFLIGDEGYRRFYRGRTLRRTAGSAHAGAVTLVRETERGLRATIYFPDALIGCLERYPPQRGVGRENVDEFAAFVEEVDHLLMIAERCRQQRPLSLFELELHANVSKYLVLARFLAGARGALPDEERIWLRYRLFERGKFDEPDAEVRSRYRDAARWAVRMLDRMTPLAPATRVDTLRRFHAAGSSDKVELIRGLCG